MTSLPDMTPRRFFAEVVLPYQSDDCLDWPFCKATTGYGKMGRGGKTVNVHRLACIEIHGTPPTPRHETAHSCGNRACCNPRHLRWDTRKGNFADKRRHGTLLAGERHSMAKLTEADVVKIRSMAGKMLYREIAPQFGVLPGTVGKIVRRERWGHV